MTTTETLLESEPAARASLIRRVWGAPLWAHVAALALLLAVLLPFMSPRSSFTSDEGAYALQERALADGSWAYDYPAAPLDPDGSYFPLNQADRGGDAFYPYVKHPAYPLLLRGSTAVFGETLGLHVPALLGVLGVAVAAWLLAAGIDRRNDTGGRRGGRLSRAAFWLAVSSPVLVNGYLLWAHTVSAALAGLALVGAVRMARAGPTSRLERPVLTTVGVTGCLVAGVLLRSEGLLFAGALAVAVAAVQLRRAGLWRAMLTFGILLGPALAAELAERTWIRSIVGVPSSNLGIRGGTSSFLAGRLEGTWHELFQAHLVKGAAGLPAILAMGLVAGLGYLALRRWSRNSRRDLCVALVAGSVLYLVRLHWYPMDPITGLFAAWPLALLGLFLFPWRRSGAFGRVLGVTAALFAAAVLVTQYAGGGGAEWGGRFFSPLLVPLAVLAAAGLDRGLAAAPHVQRRQVTGLMAVFAVVTALVALATVGRVRLVQDRMAAAAARHPAPVTVTTFPGLPRVAWRTAGSLTWMHADEQKDLNGLVRSLYQQGITEVTVVAEPGAIQARAVPYPSLQEIREPDLARLGMSLFILRA